MPRHGRAGPHLSFGFRLPRLRRDGGLGLLNHSADPRTDLDIEAAPGPRLARHQTTPMLYRMWLGALDLPAVLGVLVEKNVISLNCFDEHPLGADLISHAANASSVRATLLRSFLARLIPWRPYGVASVRDMPPEISGGPARSSPIVRLRLDLMSVNIDACRIQMAPRQMLAVSRRRCCASH